MPILYVALSMLLHFYVVTLRVFVEHGDKKFIH